MDTNNSTNNSAGTSSNNSNNRINNVSTIFNIKILVSGPPRKHINVPWWMAKDYYAANPDRLQQKRAIDKIVSYLKDWQKDPLKPPAWRPQAEESETLLDEIHNTFMNLHGDPFNRITTITYNPRQPNNIERLLWPRYYTENRRPDPENENIPLFSLTEDNLRAAARQLYRTYMHDNFFLNAPPNEPTIYEEQDPQTAQEIDQIVDAAMATHIVNPIIGQTPENQVLDVLQDVIPALHISEPIPGTSNDNNPQPRIENPYNRPIVPDINTSSEESTEEASSKPPTTTPLSNQPINKTQEVCPKVLSFYLNTNKLLHKSTMNSLHPQLIMNPLLKLIKTLQF